MSSEWDWFCGVNYTLNSGTGLNNSCLINGIIVVPQLGFVVISSLILTFLAVCSTSERQSCSKYLLRLPGHTPRWLLTYVLLVLTLSFLAEGILTNDTYLANSLPHQPHLYVVGVTMFLGAILSIVYYHMMEKWRERHMAWLLVVYWMVSLLSMIVYMIHIVNIGEAEWTRVRFDLALGLIFLMTMMVIIETVLCTSMFGACVDFQSPPADTKKENMNFFHDYAALPSSLTYWWMDWLFTLGYRKPIEPSDLGSIPDKHTSDAIHARFKKNYLKEKNRAHLNGQNANLWRVYLQTYGLRMAIAGMFKLTADMLQFVGPLCISGIVNFVTDALYVTSGEKKMIPSPHHVTVTEFLANGYVLVGCITVSAFARHTFDQTYYFWTAVEGVHIKSAIQSLVYEKSLRLSTYAMSGGMMSMGQVTNHMSVDATNLQFFFNFGNELWIIPIRIALTLVLLYMQLGAPSLIGSSLFFIVIPIQIFIATATARFTKEVLIRSDKRLKSSNELLEGIKVLKLYGWERLFEEGIKKLRAYELDKLFQVYSLSAINFVTNSGTPILVNLLSFTTYTAITGNVLAPDVAFSSLSFFNNLTSPMFIFPYVISLFVNAHVSTKRLQSYFSGPEVEGSPLNDLPNGSTDYDQMSVSVRRCRSKDQTNSKGDELEIESSRLLDSHGNGGSNYGSMQKSSSSLPSDVAIRITNGSYTWDPYSTAPIIRDLNIDIPAGQLTVVIGTVGSGKSSLLQAIMGEMTTLRGNINIREGSKTAFSPQKAWLINATLKENILFGTENDKTKYQKVVDACALGPDIAMLPGGDHTEIGEKGINLSGGQKQRVSVARTMYSDRDIVILDDPLSALDMHVGAHLFENGILKILKKQKRTIILVTHQLQYLPEADKIIVMKDGQIELQGDPEEIAKADPSLCADWQRALRVFSESEAELSGNESEALQEERLSLKKQVAKLQQTTILSTESSQNENAETEKGRLIVKEDQETGSVESRIYFFYFKSMNYWVTLGILVTVAARAGTQIGSNFFLADWSEISVTTNDTQEILDQTNFYITYYSVLSALTILMRICSIIFITAGAYLAAKSLHIKMLDNIISIPMRFFDTTPTGRFMNRLSFDTQMIDQRIIQSIRMFINTLSMVLSSLIVNIAVNIYFIIFVIPTVITFIVLLVYYLKTSRELQRCESVTRSPIFSHFSETLGGLPTIRAYQDEKRFFKISQERILVNNRVFLYLVAAQRWVAIRLDYLGALIVTVSSLTVLIGAFYLGIDVSYVGLAISYSLEIALYLNRNVRAAADIELQMNAVERVQYYIEVPSEDYTGDDPPDEWPTEGKIKVDNIHVRYGEELDTVLKGLSLSIPAQSKIGICGRTGSGKSSLTLALFRMIQTCKGRIIIDGIDIATVPLRTLRQRLSIIPQDAFLFTGTIRNNLDPTSVKGDTDLWQALEIAQLKDVVQQLDGGLDYEVTEGGDNFSVGQRQLFCLARAFLRNSRIVIMDEATASIDQETDSILQDAVADTFQDRTVLTIAHRVGTILDSDTILTLQEGKIIEFDSPTVLLEREHSVFASLVKAGK
ncbi:ATP-binding cassette sub-family C member 9-like isoform X1 [Lytechinus pictus]|uniref:ATP-binding cassette sub-family C member 9-like isoform X1 n=1 Tax=Lytechinus pictus TaxID=7653 RepID=UPI0030B9E3D3